MLSLEKEKIKVLLLEGVDPIAAKIFEQEGYTNIEKISSALDENTLIEKLQDTFILGIRSKTQLTQKVIDQAPKLLAIGCYCIGTNQVDLESATFKGIPVFNAPHANTRSVAELVLGLSVMLMRNIFPKSSAAHLGKWLKTATDSHELRGKIIGIVGYGHIGSQVSVLAEAFGMSVYYYDTESKLPLGNAKAATSLKELVKISDIISFHVPETKSTLQMMNRELFSHVKKGTCLINTSRGPVVDIDALKDALEKGSVMGAAVDVFPEEPDSLSGTFHSPLQGRPQVILTPHIGGSTMEAQVNIGKEVSEKLVLYSDRGASSGAVNFPAIYLPVHKNTHRVLHIHKNTPGVLQRINQAIGEEGINIQSQYLLTNADIGYVVFDIEKRASLKLKKALQSIPGTIRVRVLF